jgi:hypothetical protein
MPSCEQIHNEIKVLALLCRFESDSQTKIPGRRMMTVTGKIRTETPPYAEEAPGYATHEVFQPGRHARRL